MILAGDVGGTKVNLALCEVAGRRVKVQSQKRYASTQFDGLRQILETYFLDTGTSPNDVSAVCLGVPGPIVDGKCQTVNLPWVIEERQLTAIFSDAKVKLLNDLEAMAHGLPALSIGEGLSVLREGPNVDANRGLIAPGTGLGEAILFWNGHTHLVSPSEGGHCDFGPQDEEQIELLKWLWPRHKHASWEHVASGPAIARLYRFLDETGRESPPSELVEELSGPGVDPSPIIGRYAIAGKYAICVRTMDLWMFCLGAEAGNLALKTMSRGGVYIGGGVVPNVLELFKRPAFFDGFGSKGRMSEMIRSVPIYAVTDQHAALYGAAIVGDSLTSSQ